MLKIFLLRNGGFEEGGGRLEKQRPVAVLHDEDGNGCCPSGKTHKSILSFIMPF